MYEAVPVVSELNKVSGFDPLKYLRKTKNGWNLDLKIKKLWFRLKYPAGRTRMVTVKITDQLAIMEARVYFDKNDTQPAANFTAQRESKSTPGGLYIEAAQHEAMDEALTAAGFGIQFIPANALEPEQVFYVGVILYLINRDEIPEFKIPWLLILCFLPVIGAFVYMLLSSNSTSEKVYKRYQKAEQEIFPYEKQDAKHMHQLKEMDADAYIQANYLYNASKMPCCSHTRTTYYPIGEKFHAALLADLETAEHFIFMEYFIVQEGQMWDPIHAILKKKAAQGVKVFFLYDDFGCMTTHPERFYEQLKNEGIHCALSNKFTPILSHIHNNRDHRKITVIDGRIGFTGGINLADEYINTIVKHGHWKDTAVRMEGEAVKNLMLLFITNWNSQSKEHIDCNEYKERSLPVNNVQGFVIPFGDGPEPIYSSRIGKNVYLNMINAAKDYLYITTPYLICDHELMNALRITAQKGVDVRIITPHIPDKKAVQLMTLSNYQALVRDGVKIYEYTPGFIHAKNFVCEDKIPVYGTINLDYRSLVHHFECGAWMYGTDCISDMKQDFLQTLTCSERIALQRAKLKLWQRLPAKLMKLFSPLS